LTYRLTGPPGGKITIVAESLTAKPVPIEACCPVTPVGSTIG
jgi:hypothetical protein